MADMKFTILYHGQVLAEGKTGLKDPNPTQEEIEEYDKNIVDAIKSKMIIQIIESESPEEKAVAKLFFLDFKVNGGVSMEDATGKDIDDFIKSQLKVELTF